MPSHLRKYAEGYDLESWVDNKCPLEEYFGLIHPLAEGLPNRPLVDTSDAEEILVNLAANTLDAELTLEDYVFSVNPPLDFHDLSQKGAVAPVCEAAAVLVVRRYRAAVENGKWTPPASPSEATDE